jgi:ribosome maturation factor RimP
MHSVPDIEKAVRQLAEGLLPDASLYIVAVLVRGNPATELTVEVLADGDEGIGIDDVVELSRALGAAMEEQNLIEVPYNLEVGSPGVDLPLQGERQYRKNVDRQLVVTLKDGSAAEGRLADVLGDGFLLELKSTKKKPHPKSPEGIALAAGLGPAPEIRHIAFADVDKAVVQVVF